MAFYSILIHQPSEGKPIYIEIQRSFWEVRVRAPSMLLDFHLIPAKQVYNLVQLPYQSGVHNITILRNLTQSSKIL